MWPLSMPSSGPVRRPVGEEPAPLSAGQVGAIRRETKVRQLSREDLCPGHNGCFPPQAPDDRSAGVIAGGRMRPRW